jgi:hypothetical protein
MHPSQTMTPYLFKIDFNIVSVCDEVHNVYFIKISCTYTLKLRIYCENIELRVSTHTHTNKNVTE